MLSIGIEVGVFKGVSLTLAAKICQVEENFLNRFCYRKPILWSPVGILQTLLPKGCFIHTVH